MPRGAAQENREGVLISVLIALIPFVLDYLHVQPLSVRGSCQAIPLPLCVSHKKAGFIRIQLIVQQLFSLTA